MNEERIIIMSKLAVYDKNFGEKDRLANRFFRTDYVYRKNMWTRFYVFIGCLFLVCVYALRVFIVDGQDIFAFDYRGELIRIGIYVLAVLVVYTLISTKIYISEFNRAQRRFGNYIKLIKLLNEISGFVQPAQDTGEFEQEEPEDGASLYYTRNDSKIL
ncbi:MAG: hypothetical protein FWE92_01055 [Defluviitaleaceae bacterium]|nr:hypothetical protein [Defluviitaleaceae bacterium]